MKKYFVILVVGISLGFIGTSCLKCTTCEIQDGSTSVIGYDEFCGTPGEAKSFMKDVEFDANNLRCVTCTLKGSDNSTIKKIYKKYGSVEDLDEFMEDLADRADIENWFYSCEEVRTEFATVSCTE